MAKRKKKSDAPTLNNQEEVSQDQHTQVADTPPDETQPQPTVENAPVLPEIVAEIVEETPPEPERLPLVESRVVDRVSTKVEAVIQGKDGDESWKELVEIATVSRQGAGFTMSRECGVGRLLMMVIKMPREFRLYDHDEDVYPMLAVVQNCYAVTQDDSTVFNLGVAFTGKRVPDTYRADSSQCYRITGMSADGLWQIVESENTFKTRRHSRFSRRLEVNVSIRDNERRETNKYKVFTKDISVGGMSVWGPLDARVGDRVKLSSEQHNFYSIALVRNRVDNTEDETKSLVHFEFEGVDFPVHELHPNIAGVEPEEAKAKYDDGTKEAAIVLDSY